MLKTSRLLFTTLCLLIVFGAQHVQAQSLLDKTITVNVKEKALGEVLNEIGKKGDFYFSYDGRLIPKDSLITIAVTNQSIKAILAQLFNDKYDLDEKDNYIIITAPLPRLALINPDVTSEDNAYSVSGIVINERTGERLMNASVYDKRLLMATLTDAHGYFRIRLKTDHSSQITLTVSKLNFKNTSFNILQPVNVSSRAGADVYANAANKENRVEKTGLGRFLISTRQKIQSLNIPDFFASRPFQISLTPGLSSHGMFSPQVINKFSVNLAGGYTAGTNGLEFGGLFNINKGDARYLQIAGIFNLVGGNAVGLQIAGAHNRTLDTLKGVQFSLFTNKAEAQVSGVQLSALHNETGRLKGLQIGLVNFADTSHGVSIGMINIIRNGFYKISYSANKLANTNISLKTGTHDFYSTFLISANPSVHNKLYAFGLGIGHDFMLSDKIYLSAEADYQFANTGLWEDRWAQAKLLLNVQLTKNISLFGGVNYNAYSYNGSKPGYQTQFTLPIDKYYHGYYTNPVKKWTGWEAGIAFNSVFKPSKKTIDNSQGWYLGLAATAGIGWDEPYSFVSGGELSVQRDLGDYLTGTLSTGYTHFAVKSGYRVGLVDNADIYDKPVNLLPVKAGIRLKTGKLFYFAGEIGAALGKEPSFTANGTSIVYGNASYRSLMYAVSAGLSFKSRLETGIKFEDYGLQSQYKQFALRLGYRIKLGK